MVKVEHDIYMACSLGCDCRVEYNSNFFGNNNRQMWMVLELAQGEWPFDEDPIDDRDPSRDKAPKPNDNTFPLSIPG